MRTRQAAVAMAVLATHLAIVLVAWHSKMALPRGGGTPRVTTLRLIPAPVEQRARQGYEPRVAQQPAAPPSPRSQASAKNVDASDDPAPMVPIAEPRHGLPGPAAYSGAPDAPGSVGLDGSEIRAPASAASGARGLVLTPDRQVLLGSLANPAVMDPRSNSPSPTFEERIAMGMNPDLCLKLERLPDGTVRRTLARRVELPSTLQATHGNRTAPVRVCP